jgi:hypothetical protein
MAETPEDFSPAARAEQERMYHELRESLNDDPGESLCHGVPISEALEMLAHSHRSQRQPAA